MLYDITFSCEYLIQGGFFNCSSQFSVPKWKKTSCTQPEILFQEIFNVKKLLVGWAIFFILVLKMGRKSNKNTLYFEDNCKSRKVTNDAGSRGGEPGAVVRAQVVEQRGEKQTTSKWLCWPAGWALGSFSTGFSCPACQRRSRSGEPGERGVVVGRELNGVEPLVWQSSI